MIQPAPAFREGRNIGYVSGVRTLIATHLDLDMCTDSHSNKGWIILLFRLSQWPNLGLYHQGRHRLRRVLKRCRETLLLAEM